LDHADDLFKKGAAVVMTHPHVLSVGQCAFDQGRIVRYLEASFHAQVQGAATFAEALAVLRSERFDLVLVNRVNDHDDAPGHELIRSLKAEPDLADIPVMLVSNYSEAQKEAEALGALPGFGKAELTSKVTHARLGVVLGSPASSS
jgi:two-component system, chemotaxis family, chemotaxis protein CheY